MVLGRTRRRLQHSSGAWESLDHNNPKHLWVTASCLSMIMLGLSPTATHAGLFDVFFGDGETQQLPSPPAPIGGNPYDVTINGIDDDNALELLQDTMLTTTLAEQGVPDRIFLEARIEQDKDDFRQVMNAFGYYNASMTTQITTNGNDGFHVIFDVKPGNRFHLEPISVQFVQGPNPDIILPDFVALEIAEDFPAIARNVLDGEKEILRTIQAQGYAYAKLVRRETTADLGHSRLSVQFDIALGPKMVIGKTSYVGLLGIKKEFPERYREYEEGDPYSPQLLADFRKALSRTEIFSKVLVEIPEQPPENGVVPVTVSVDPGKPRSFSVSLDYATDDRGLGGKAAFVHRNILGSGERLSLSIEGDQKGSIGAGEFVVPRVIFGSHDAVGRVVLTSEEKDNHEEYSFISQAGMKRPVANGFSYELGGYYEVAEIKDLTANTDNWNQLTGFYLDTSLDTRDDRLNPANGFNIHARVMPLFGIVDDEPSDFIELEGSLAAYYAIDDAKRYVLAGRTRLGTVISSEHQKVPDNHRFYAGGAGSVRGYDRDIIGPLDNQNKPEGGRFVFEVGAEIRAQIYGDVGLALFAESAMVDEQPNPQADTDLQTGVGVGLRYYSPVGPVRLDLAIPLEKRAVDSDFELYISLGQAF